MRIQTGISDNRDHVIDNNRLLYIIINHMVSGDKKRKGDCNESKGDNRCMILSVAPSSGGCGVHSSRFSQDVPTSSIVSLH